MKIFFAFLGLLFATLGARAQTACPTPPPAGCPEPFRVVDAGTGQEITVLQVGCPVRFEQNCGRVTAPALLYYQVVKGTNAIPVNCLPTTTAGVNTYTPTVADVGPVTVFELSNPSSGSGGSGVAYIRNYTVVNPAPPTFTVAPCANGVALLTLTNPVYSSYTIQVNGGVPQPLVSPQQVNVLYGTGLSNTFVVTGNPGSSCPQSATQTLALPVNNSPTFVSLRRTGAVPSGGGAVLDFYITTGFTTTLERENPTSPGTYTTVAGTTITPTAGAMATTSLPTAQGRYRLVSADACGNNLPSNALATLGLDGTAANGRNVLSFLPFDQAAVTSYVLYRSPGGLQLQLPRSATGYDDATVQCGTTYTYRLEALMGQGAATSNTITLTAQSTTPPPAPVVVPSFDLNNYVVVTTTPSAGAAFGPGGQVLLSRQGGGGNFAFSPLRTGTAGLPRRVLRDSILSTLPTVVPCYSAVVRDTCGNASPTSPSSCPALLSVTTTDPDGLTAQLTWSAFQGPGSPAAPVVYRVLTIAADGSVLATSAATTSLTYLDLAPPTDRQILRYRVEASGGGLPAGTVSYSNVGTLTRRPRLVIPTAFTPNNDGLNDVLELKGRYLQNFVFIIVDRNGQEVFRATDRTQTWDGTTKGRAPVNGAYVWRFDLTGEDNQPFRQTGTITILK